MNPITQQMIDVITTNLKPSIISEAAIPLSEELIELKFNLDQWLMGPVNDAFMNERCELIQDCVDYFYDSNLYIVEINGVPIWYWLE